MGLDMFLERTKKIEGMTLEEILETADYIEYLERPSEYLKSSFKQWCNGNENMVRKDKLDDVKKYTHTTEVAYWRKANAIHKWFVDNCGGGINECQYMEVSKDQLEELLDIAQKVRNSCELIKGKKQNGSRVVNGEIIPSMMDWMYVKDPSVAMKYLPTEGGFFFGSTDYDEWYVEGLDETIRQIKNILETTDFDNEYVTYCAS